MKGEKNKKMSFSDRELLARIILCEAGGEGENGMKAVATVVMNRVNVQTGEYFRVSEGGNIRNIIFQKNQFTCAIENISNMPNMRSIYTVSPDQVHFEIADWAISGNKLNEVGECLWFMNPGNKDCGLYFPPNQSGIFHTRVNQHCFFRPTEKYNTT